MLSMCLDLLSHHLQSLLSGPSTMRRNPSGLGKKTVASIHGRFEACVSSTPKDKE